MKGERMKGMKGMKGDFVDFPQIFQVRSSTFKEE